MWLRRFRITDRCGASQIGSVIPRASFGGGGGGGHIQGDSGQLTGSVIRYWGGWVGAAVSAQTHQKPGMEVR